MEFSVFLPSSPHAWKHAKRAEDLGYACAWFYDTPMINAELFTIMGAAAVNTTRIRLGTGVLVPSNRIEPTVACALATLNALAPGRINFGVGTGFTARRSLGLSAMKAADFEAYIHTVMALLAGETPEWSTEGVVHKIRFLNPDVGIINIQDSIRLFISAFGPKMRDMTARLGAGLICGADDPGALAAMRSAWESQGRDPATLQSVMITGGAVLAEGEPADSDRAKAQAGPLAAMVFHNEIERAELTKGSSSGGVAIGVPERFRPQLDAYQRMYDGYEPADARYLTNHRGHLLFLRPGEADQMTDDVVRTFTLTGTKTELVEKIRALRDNGLQQLGVEMRYGHEPAMLEDWADVFAAV